MGLTVISTHPIQYQAPIYRILQSRFGIPVTAIYGSDFSVVGYKDKEFNAHIAWDKGLLDGYRSVFLSNTSDHKKENSGKISSRDMYKVLKETKPDGLLLSGYGSLFHLAAFWYSFKIDCPVFFRGEPNDSARPRNILKRCVRNILLSILYQKCARLLYIGRHSYQHFKQFGYSEKKLIFSPYCVDTTPFQCGEKSRDYLRLNIRQKLNIKEDETVFIFSGKLVKRKNTEIILHAIRKLPAMLRENVVVMFLGSGEMKNRLENLAGNYPPVKAHFLGFKNQHELSAYYHAADLLILPSRYSETWGLVVNEALHHGLPCVVSDKVGCAPDLIEEGVTGEIFKSGSTRDLALAIQRAYKLINRVETRESCREKVSAYTIEKAAEGIARAYLDCCNITNI